MDLFTKPWNDSGCLETTATGEEVATLRCIWPLLSNIINAAIILSSAVALIFIIWGGIQIITANGDQEKIQGAKKTLTFAILGFVFIALSFVAFNFVFKAIGVDPNGVDLGGNREIIISPSL